MECMIEVKAADIRIGDRVDLEGDDIADWDGRLVACELATVTGSVRETADCVRVDFEDESFGFPPEHLLRIVPRTADRGWEHVREYLLQPDEFGAVTGEYDPIDIEEGGSGKVYV
jgi:hypothetical protein